MMVTFEDITNQIAVIAKNNQDVEELCQTAFGSSLTVQDNSILLSKYKNNYPFCEINKGNEEAYKNEEASNRKMSNSWTGYIEIFGKFQLEYDSMGETKLPDVAVETVNGVLTYTPSDIMRRIARHIGEDMYKKIACSNNTQGVIMSKYNIGTEVYYNEEDGSIGASLEFELYRRNTAY